jgi:uncharacterized iron-regulated membrane protein
MTTVTYSSGAEKASAETGLYRAVWRWHFYAGLLCLPFMISLAITGSLYLFQNEINHIIYRPLMVVDAQNTTPLKAADLIARAQLAVDGTPVRHSVVCREISRRTADRSKPDHSALAGTCNRAPARNRLMLPSKAAGFA